MRRILLSSLLLIASAAAGCGAEPEFTVTPQAAAVSAARTPAQDSAKTTPAEEDAAKAPENANDTAKADVVKPVQARRVNSLGIECEPNIPDPGCGPMPSPGRLPGDIP